MSTLQKCFITFARNDIYFHKQGCPQQIVEDVAGGEGWGCWGPPILNENPVKFGGQRFRESADIRFLISHVSTLSKSNVN